MTGYLYMMYQCIDTGINTDIVVKISFKICQNLNRQKHIVPEYNDHNLYPPEALFHKIGEEKE